MGPNTKYSAGPFFIDGPMRSRGPREDCARQQFANDGEPSMKARRPPDVPPADR